MAITTYSSTEAFQRELLFVIYQHKGRENTIDRWSLVRRLFGAESVPAGEESDSNPYDRRVRDNIEILRKPPHQHLICNMGDGSGYFIARTRAEYDAWKKYYLGSTYEKWVVVNGLDAVADETWGKVPKEPDPLPLFSGQLLAISDRRDDEAG